MGKICNKCGLHKEYDRFTKTNRSVDGFYGYCKDCGNKESTENYRKRKHGLKEKKVRTKCDESYFEKIDCEEKSYWLGFLYADGCVRKRHNSGTLQLKLCTKDIGHIEKFKKSIQSEHIIKSQQSCVIKKDKKYISYSSLIAIYSTKIVDDLIIHGCVPNKTQKIRLPHIQENLFNHFLRGYFDGDGCIHKVKERPNSFGISIVSNKYFILELKQKIEMGHIIEYDNYSLLVINKISDIKKLRDLIYKNSNIFLKRKYDIFSKIDDNFKRDYSLTKNKKTYIVTDPNGIIHTTSHLVKFCKENKLVYSSISNLSRGVGKTCRGWKCEEYKKQ